MADNPTRTRTPEGEASRAPAASSEIEVDQGVSQGTLSLRLLALNEPEAAVHTRVYGFNLETGELSQPHYVPLSYVTEPHEAIREADQRGLSVVRSLVTYDLPEDDEDPLSFLFPSAPERIVLPIIGHDRLRELIGRLWQVNCPEGAIRPFYCGVWPDPETNRTDHDFEVELPIGLFGGDPRNREVITEPSDILPWVKGLYAGLGYPNGYDARIDFLKSQGSASFLDEWNEDSLVTLPNMRLVRIPYRGDTLEAEACFRVPISIKEIQSMDDKWLRDVGQNPRLDHEWPPLGKLRPVLAQPLTFRGGTEVSPRSARIRSTPSQEEDKARTLDDLFEAVTAAPRPVVFDIASAYRLYEGGITLPGGGRPYFPVFEGDIIMLLGDTGLGKSAFFENLVVRLPFGVDQGQPVPRVLMLPFENGEQETLYRLLQIAHGLSINTSRRINEVQTAIIERKQEELKQPIEHIVAIREQRVTVEKLKHMIEKYRVQVVLIDTLEGIIPHTRDTVSATGQTLSQLREVLRETRSAALVVHHIGKSAMGEAITLKSSKGAKTILENAQVVLGFNGERFSAHRFVEQLKGRGRKMPPQKGTYGFSLIGDEDTYRFAALSTERISQLPPQDLDERAW